MTICHGCNQPLEPAAQVRTYHRQCDPQMRVETLERALQELAEIEPDSTRHDVWAMADAVNGIARAALAYKPAQMKEAGR